MPIFIYNSLTRKKEEFIPLKPPYVNMYVCGPTVYDQPHIGHARSAYVFEVIRRYLIYRGYKVKFARNVTDVDDKIIDKAKKEFPGEDLNLAVKKVSEKYLNLYHQDTQLLGISQPDAEPRATEYLTQGKPLMQDFIAGLIEKGAAYVSGGDVYFDIKKAQDYGKLSNQSLDKMEASSRIMAGENKKDPLDFALWKAAKPEEPSWISPWGRGRPGWHIECSVMSSSLLGDEFDIHGGGLDLIFPHHENEIAQSEACGKKFAKYWIHHGLLTINSQKMSKSLGNFVTIGKVLERYHPDVLKLFFLQTHYPHPIDYSEKKMDEINEYYRSFVLLSRDYREKFIKYGEVHLQEEEIKEIDQEYRDKFIQAMDDNFNSPVALSLLNHIKSDVFSMTANFTLKNSWPRFQYLVKMIEELLANNFGIFPNFADLENDDRLLTEHSIQLRKIVKESVVDLESWKKEQGKQIEKLRSEKRFAEADEKKKELRNKGFEVLDKKDGTTEVR